VCEGTPQIVQVTETAWELQHDALHSLPWLVREFGIYQFAKVLKA